MNKTVSIHLQGIPFIFEEGAYESLDSYLNALRKVLANEPGLEEIIQDVELRIVELVQQQLTGGKQVVEQKVIQEIITKIGQPKDFSNENITDAEPHKEQSSKRERRFFRDTEKALLGGVCAGAAAYFNIDIVVIRAIYLIAFLTFGVGGLLYFILWIIIPSAKTSSEKLQMRGEAVNLENMKSELRTATNRIKKGASSLRNNGSVGEIFQKSARIFGISVGLFILLIGTILLITALIFLFIQPQFIPVEINGEHFSLNELLPLVFEKHIDFQRAFWGIGLVLLSITGLCFVTGIRCLKHFPSKIVYWSFGFILLSFIGGISLSAMAGINFAQAMDSYGEVEKEVGIYRGTHLVLKNEQKNKFIAGGYTINSEGDDLGFYVKDDNIFFRGVEISYEPSEDSLFHIYQINSSQGKSHEHAIYNARKVKSSSQLMDSVFNISPTYFFPKTCKLRDQKLTYRITVPSNGMIWHEGEIIYPLIDSSAMELRTHGYFSVNGEYSAW